MPGKTITVGKDTKHIKSKGLVFCAYLNLSTKHYFSEGYLRQAIGLILSVEAVSQIKSLPAAFLLAC